MLVDRIVKETTDISRDFLDMSWWLDEGETITKVVSQTVILGAYGWSDAPYPLQGGEMPYDPFPLEIDSAVVAAGGTQLEVFVSEGSPSLAYTCQFVLDGSSTRRVTIEMGVQVTGVPLSALGSGPLPSYLAVTIADTPPSDPQPGQLWFDSIDPQLYIWYDDPSSSQWVIVTSDKGGLATDAPYDGGIYGRQDGVWVSVAGSPPLNGGTLLGPLNWIATGSTALRSAQDRSADWVNVLDFGAKLNGVTDDSAAFIAARAAAQARSPNAVVYVPTGTYNVVTPPAYTSTPVQWFLDGVTNPDGSFVTSVTVGDQLENYMQARGKYYQRTDPVGAAFPVGALHNPVLRIDYTGKGSSLGILQVNGIQNDGSGFLWGVEGQLTLNQTGTGQCIAVVGATFRTAPSSPGWAMYGQFIDNSGLATGSGGTVCGELDTYANGPEPSTTYFAPSFGNRIGLHIGLSNATHAGWVANKVYATGTVINPAGSSAYVYICTVGGTSGAIEPAWPTAAGTVVDGAVTWSFGTTLSSQYSRGLHISGSGTNQVAAPIYFTGMQIFDAVIDMSSSTVTQATALNSNIAAIRIGPDWPIDFSGGGVNAQNNRILRYNSTANALEYVDHGVTTFSIADTSGAVAIGAPHTPGYQFEVKGTNTVGIATANGSFTTAIRMGTDQSLSFEGSDAHYMQYRAATQRLYYVVGGVDMWSVDASGNVRAKGTLTGSTTP